MNVVIAPDSFKGSLTALAAAQAMEAGVRRVFPGARTRLFPLADGGEGTLDAILHARGGERRSVVVEGADGTPVTAAWGIIDDAGACTAVIESAQVVGLAPAESHPVARRSTRGLGQLLRHCLDAGLRHFLVGLGGTSTNDGGTGLLDALGVAFRDAQGRPVTPTPEGLAQLAAADFAGLDPRLAGCAITLLTDVDNPLTGPEGATAVFGPQKGVRPEEVPVFDARLARWAALGDDWAGRAVCAEPGAGAAGGLGYAFLLLGAVQRPGAQVVCELMGLATAIADARWVLTGEGRSDAQTLHGKLPFEVARLARAHGVPVSLVSGRIDPAARAALEAVFDGCFEAAPEPMPLAAAMAHAAQLVADAAERAARARAARPQAGM